MQVKIRLFATLRQLAGWTQLTLDLPAEATVAAALAEVDRQYPQLTFATRTIYVAVNQEYARGTQVLGPGDEVAIFPPVSGGAPRRAGFFPAAFYVSYATEGTNNETL